MRVDRAVLDLSALAALLGVVPLEAPEVDTAVAADATLLDLVDLLRSYHEHRAADVHGDLVAVSMVVDRWEPAGHYATDLVGMACADRELGIAEVGALALARTAGLPLVTGLGELANVDADLPVVVLARRGS